jgi:hypothetical protein
MVMKKFIYFLVSYLFLADVLEGVASAQQTGTNVVSLNQEIITPSRFREIVGMPGDSQPLEPQLVLVPFWTNAIVSNVMTYESGKVFKEEMNMTAKTVGGKYVVFTVYSKFYNQPMNSILAYDEKASILKSYGLYANGHGEDIVTEGVVAYNYAKKTYGITSSYGDGFNEITTGSYTATEDSAKTVVKKNGSLFMTQEVKTYPNVTTK